ncbi:hypothetical protein L6255_00225 [Candidatus Parcubacteria bacterium]|nr:hypothetical protein [Patescibacteria group bacterium]MBU4381370.1 hypothetical protein [Patescibacteria group bacterium]MCG2688866.1 hypothetical protein [Candidatus Parcubacteria bacterium]
MIATLPMTPKGSSAPLGYWLTPVIADILRERSSDSLAVCIGTIGAKSPSVADILLFREELDFVGVRKAKVLTDGELVASLERNVATILSRVESSDIVSECYVCECGLLEIPIEQVRFLKPKTFHIENGKVFCVVCGGEATTSTQSRFCMFFPESAFGKSPQIHPRSYSAEIRDLMGQIRRNGICVGKNRPTGFLYSERNLDVELVWQTMPYELIHQENDKRLVLVVSNHVLKQGLLAILLARTLGFNGEIHLIVTPYINHPGTVGKWCLEKLAELGHDELTARFMLANSLGWSLKDATLSTVVSEVGYRRLRLFARRVAESRRSTDNPEKLVEDINHQTLTLGLKHVFNPDKFDYARLSGLYSS